MGAYMHVLGRTMFSLAFFGVSGAALAEDAKPAAPPAGTQTTATGTVPAKSAGSGWVQEIAPADGSAGIELDVHQTEIVKKVDDYFSNLDGLKGYFVQTDAEKRKLKGKFYVQRPGKFRFDYSPPSRQIIVSDGHYLAIQDLDLNNEDRVSLDQTPCRLLLRKDVDLLRDARIYEVQEADDLIVLGLQDKSPDTPGKIKLFLSTKPGLELKEWVTTDAQGLDTRVEVSNVERTAQLDEKLFKIQQLGARLGTPR